MSVTLLRPFPVRLSGWAFLKAKELLISRKVPRTESVLPAKVYIETIAGCNLRCPFCPAWKRKDSGTIMARALFDKIVGELAEAGYGGSIAFHCNNEPLLDDRLETLVAAARKRLPRSFFYLYSNGSRAGVERINGLFSAGLDRVIIDNYDDRFQLTPQAGGLVRAGDSIRGEVIIKMRRLKEIKGNRAGQSPNASSVLSEPLRLRCFRPMLEMAVPADGRVAVCCADALARTVVGDVSKENIVSVWNGPELSGIRRSLMGRERDCAEACRQCDALDMPEPKGM
ncbi:MAG: radical SAM/SPASM domain-containing protein [Deltaproteobacteria bacterium]